jgi:hypothetical protein
LGKIAGIAEIAEIAERAQARTDAYKTVGTVP